MRLRNVKNKDQILSSSPFFIADGSSYKGKWHRLFGNDRPIYLEIGMGKGKFLIENAIRYPEINFIGIERYDSVLARALEKVPEDLKNIKIVRLNAEYIEKLFDHEISLIYLNFSDPWPKKKHHRRRLTSLEFLSKYDTMPLLYRRRIMLTCLLIHFAVLVSMVMYWKMYLSIINRLSKMRISKRNMRKDFENYIFLFIA